MFYFIISFKYATSAISEFNFKAHGPNGIPAVVLKNCVQSLNPDLVNYFVSLTFPSCWKRACAEKVRHFQPSYYCPLSLVPIILFLKED